MRALTRARARVPRSRLYTVDLESGLHYLLRVELAAHSSLAGEQLKTFKAFVTVLAKVGLANSCFIFGYGWALRKWNQAWEGSGMWVWLGYHACFRRMSWFQKVGQRIVVSVWDTISSAQLCLILLVLWSVPVGRPSVWAIDGSGTPCKVLGFDDIISG